MRGRCELQPGCWLHYRLVVRAAASLLPPANNVENIDCTAVSAHARTHTHTHTHLSVSFTWCDPHPQLSTQGSLDPPESSPHHKQHLDPISRFRAAQLTVARDFCRLDSITDQVNATSASAGRVGSGLTAVWQIHSPLLSYPAPSHY